MAPRDFHVWHQVPPGSVLVLRLETEGAVLARGVAVRSAAGVGVEETAIPHVRLVEGVRVLEMEDGISGTASVTLHFPAAAATAVLTASVLAPGGGAFRDAFLYEVAGARGDTFRAILLLTTETLDLGHDVPA